MFIRLRSCVKSLQCRARGQRTRKGGSKAQCLKSGGFSVGYLLLSKQGAAEEKLKYQ